MTALVLMVTGVALIGVAFWGDARLRANGVAEALAVFVPLALGLVLVVASIAAFFLSVVELLR